jgi:UDP-glucose 4-epimerase
MADLRDARVLITGGAGLVGSHLADQLLTEDVAEVVVLDNLVRGRLANLGQALASGRVTLVEGDVRDTGLLAKVTDGVDVLFHQAAIRITQCAEEPRLAFDVLAAGTFNVLEAAVTAKVGRVVAASSASVYGQAEEYPTSERHHPYNNRTLYGAAKTFNEGLLRSFNDMYGLDYVALRYFNVYGERMDIHGAYTEVLVRWMERIQNGQPPLIHGDGSMAMDFIHVADIARANVLAARATVTDEVLNVGRGVQTSLVELARVLSEVMGRGDLTPEFGPARRAAPVGRRQADTNRAAELIGFTAQIGLEEGLRRLVDWWRAERAEGPPGAARRPQAGAAGVEP